MRLIYALMGVALMTGLGAAAEPRKLSEAGKPQWLAIQTAEAGSFDGKTLVLTDANPVTTLFTDRPLRIARGVPTSRFLAAWNKGGRQSLAADPPNAGVTMIADGKLTNAVVKLGEPKLDGKTLTYTVSVIEGTLAASGKTVSIFIDDFGLADFSSPAIDTIGPFE